MLEEKTIVRVGGSKPIHTDVRVLAATNQKLAELVRAKRFREDLYFRLNVVTLELPPLRDRGDDILLLAEHFLQEFCRRAGRRVPEVHGRRRASGCESHTWPGNVRELRNLMERLAYLSAGDKIEAEDLAFILSPATSSPSLVDAGLQPQRRHPPVPAANTSSSRSTAPAATSARPPTTSASTARTCTAKCANSAWKPTKTPSRSIGRF